MESHNADISREASRDINLIMQMSKKDPEHSTRSNTVQTNKIILHMAPQNCEAYTIFTNGLN